MIDVKEWAGKLNEMGMLPEVVSYMRLTQWVIDLSRAVIADEAAKPAPQGDVPKGAISLEEAKESGCCRICGWSTRGTHGPINAITLNYGEEFAHTRCLSSNEWCESLVKNILARRVAEATADKDRRIAELEKRISQGHSNSFFEDVAIMSVKKHDELIAERDRLREEVSRLTKERERLAAELVRNNDDGYEDLAEIEKLKAEVSRLTRPVEGVESFRAETLAPGLLVVPEWRLQAERNSRLAAEKRAEAAEAERDELRAFMRHHNIAWYEMHENGHKVVNQIKPLTNEQLDAVLAAYRAEKGKVQQ